MIDFDDDDGMDWEDIQESIPNEVADLLAEAAKTSPHAKRAYQLLQPLLGWHDLAAAQFLTAGRMTGLPL